MCSFWGVLAVVGEMGFDVSIFQIFLCSHLRNVFILNYSYTFSLSNKNDFIPVEIHLLPVCAERGGRGCSLIPSCDKSLPNNLSVYLRPGWLRPHVPHRGDLSGPSACVSLPLTSGPFLSAPDLSTSLRGV